MRNLIKKILKESGDLEWVKDVLQSEIRPTPSLIVKQQTNNPKDAIEVHFEIMFGDADSYERNKQTFYRNPGKHGYNFNDFEEMINFMKSDENISDIDEDLREKLSDYGLIGYSEHFGDEWEIGSITHVYYYDDMGNKYIGKIDGIDTYDEDYGDDDDDLDWDDDEYCDECGEELDDGFCPNCDEDEDDENEDDDE